MPTQCASGFLSLCAGENPRLPNGGPSIPICGPGNPITGYVNFKWRKEAGVIQISSPICPSNEVNNTVAVGSWRAAWFSGGLPHKQRLYQPPDVPESLMKFAVPGAGGGE